MFRANENLSVTRVTRVRNYRNFSLLFFFFFPNDLLCKWSAKPERQRGAARAAKGFVLNSTRSTWLVIVDNAYARLAPTTLNLEGRVNRMENAASRSLGSRPHSTIHGPRHTVEFFLWFIHFYFSFSPFFHVYSQRRRRFVYVRVSTRDSGFST